MSVIRKEDLEQAGYTSFVEFLTDKKNDLKISCSSDKDDISSVLDEVEYNGNGAEIVYYNQAWEICGGACGAVEIEPLDFSQCETALDALQLEANAISSTLHLNGWNEAQDEIADNILHACETALDLGFDGDLRITSGSLFGWAPHNRETSDGCAIYDDKQGYYYPRKLEGELYAVEHEIAPGLYISACWNPEDTDGEL